MHDVNGAPLQLGDKVLIPCVITELSTASEDYCNVTVKTKFGRRPDGQNEQISAINTGVLLKDVGQLDVEILTSEVGARLAPAIFSHGCDIAPEFDEKQTKEWADLVLREKRANVTRLEKEVGITPAA